MTIETSSVQPAEANAAAPETTTAVAQESPETETASAGDPGRQDEDERRDDGQPAQAPSLARVLLYAGLVGLACGAGGGWAYAHFFSAHPEGKGASEKQAATKGASDSSTAARSRPAAPVPPRPGAVDELRKQFEELSKRVDSLGERLDVLALPRDQTPPDIRKLQVKVGELTRALDRMGKLPTEMHHLESRLEEMGEQLKSLRPPTPAQQGNVGQSTMTTPPGRRRKPRPRPRPPGRRSAGDRRHLPG